VTPVHDDLSEFQRPADLEHRREAMRRDVDSRRRVPLAIAVDRQRAGPGPALAELRMDGLLTLSTLGQKRPASCSVVKT
jgi:hypothetical protein